MKWLFIAFPTILFMLCIGGNEMSSNYYLSKEKRESYEACIKLVNKAPFFNLNCESLIDRIPNFETALNKNVINNKGIKFLSIYDYSTKKVSLSEEIKLRKLFRNLSDSNKFWKN